MPDKAWSTGSDHPTSILVSSPQASPPRRAARFACVIVASAQGCIVARWSHGESKRRRGRGRGQGVRRRDATPPPSAVARSTGTRHMAYGMPLCQAGSPQAGAGSSLADEQQTTPGLPGMNDSSKGDSGSLRRRSIHPGSGRRQAVAFPRGRVLQAEEAAAVKALLGEAPRERALLIEYLHRIQDHEGCLPEGHLQALAEELRVPMAEIYEVATFYAHFDVVGSGEERPPKVTVRVCDSLSCALAGAEGLLRAVQEKLPGVRVLRAPCIGSCHTAPAAEVGHRHVDHANAAKIEELALRGALDPELPAYQGFDSYTKAGGYAALRACLAGARKAEAVIALLSDGGLKGLGGAGFPTGRKWGLVRAEKAPRLMAVNGDEGEPGTFKDRIYLEREPHKFLEGMAIAAWAVEAEQVFIYIRDEYPAALEIKSEERRVGKG